MLKQKYNLLLHTTQVSNSYFIGLKLTYMYLLLHENLR